MVTFRQAACSGLAVTMLDVITFGAFVVVVVIMRVFVKKTEKTPRREIELALTRAKSVD